MRILGLTGVPGVVSVPAGGVVVIAAGRSFGKLLRGVRDRFWSRCGGSSSLFLGVGSRVGAIVFTGRIVVGLFRVYWRGLLVLTLSQT
jgi:hypothetical protein